MEQFRADDLLNNTITPNAEKAADTFLAASDTPPTETQPTSIFKPARKIGTGIRKHVLRPVADLLVAHDAIENLSFLEDEKFMGGVKLASLIALAAAHFTAGASLGIAAGVVAGLGALAAGRRSLQVYSNRLFIEKKLSKVDNIDLKKKGAARLVLKEVHDKATLKSMSDILASNRGSKAAKEIFDTANKVPQAAYHLYMDDLGDVPVKKGKPATNIICFFESKLLKTIRDIKYKSDNKKFAEDTKGFADLIKKQQSHVNNPITNTKYPNEQRTHLITDTIDAFDRMAEVGSYHELKALHDAVKGSGITKEVYAHAAVKILEKVERKKIQLRKELKHHMQSLQGQMHREFTEKDVDESHEGRLKAFEDHYDKILQTGIIDAGNSGGPAAQPATDGASASSSHQPGVAGAAADTRNTTKPPKRTFNASPLKSSAERAVTAVVAFFKRVFTEKPNSAASVGRRRSGSASAPKSPAERVWRAAVAFFKHVLTEESKTPRSRGKAESNTTRSTKESSGPAGSKRPGAAEKPSNGTGQAPAQNQQGRAGGAARGSPEITSA